MGSAARRIMAGEITGCVEHNQERFRVVLLEESVSVCCLLVQGAGNTQAYRRRTGANVAGAGRMDSCSG